MKSVNNYEQFKKRFCLWAELVNECTNQFKNKSKERGNI